MAPGRNVRRRVEIASSSGQSDSRRSSNSRHTETVACARSSGSSACNSPDSGTASASSKKGRGLSRGDKLRKFLASGGEKPIITFPSGKHRPVCEWGKSFVTEIGCILRQTASLTCLSWKHVPEIDRQLIENRILEMFRFDLSIPHQKEGLENFMQHRFKQFKNRCHTWYLENGGRNGGRRYPANGVTPDTWVTLCDHFDSPEFRARSEKAKENRSKMLVNHRCGSKSFARRFHELTQLRGCEPDPIVFYKDVRFHEKEGWVTEHCGELHEKMVNRMSESTVEGEDPISPNEVFDEVIGTRSGYAIGLGHGVEPPRKRRARVDTESIKRAEQAEARAEQAEARVNELQEEVTSLREEFSSRYQDMEKLVQSLMERMPPT